MDVDNTFSWHPSPAGYFFSPTDLEVEDVFEIIKQPMDGNCLYHALACGIIDEQRPDSYKTVKELVKESAGLFWNSTNEAQMSEEDLHSYLVRISRPNEWGSTLEVNFFSQKTKLTVYVWHEDVSKHCDYVMRYGQDKVAESVNILHRKNHFDFLKPKHEHKTSGADKPFLTLEEKVELFSKYSLDPEDEDWSIDQFINEDALSPELSDKRSELLERGLDSDYYRRVRKLIPKSENIPVRVGRVLDTFFSCKIVAILNNRMLLLKPMTSPTEESEALTLRTLGHKILTFDKELKKEYSSSHLALTKELISFLDLPGLLRTAFPGLGLERYAAILHDELILDVCTVAVALLLSTYLYGSNNRNKKKFITNCLFGLNLSGKKVASSLKKVSQKDLYEQPKKTVAYVCNQLYGKVMEGLSRKFGSLGGCSMLVLCSVDLSDLGVREYLQVVDNLAKLDNQTEDFGHLEIESLNSLRLVLERIQKADKEQLLDILRTTVSDIDQHIEPPKRATRSKEAAMQYVIQEYFRKKEITKFISTGGKAYSGATIGNVLAYAHNIYMSKESLRLSTEDINQLLIEIRSLHAIQGTQAVLPIAIICENLSPNFKKLFDELPEECAQECETLLEDARNADSHASAWKSALRLKGVAYEGLFAKSRGWRYVPEDIKPSLTMLVQSLYPDKFEMFLERTQLHPEFRDLVPDFSLTQKTFLRGAEIKPQEPLKTPPQADQSKPGMEAVGKGKQMFPLPEVEIQEIHSISGALEVFERQKVESGRNYFCSSNDVPLGPEDDLIVNELLLVEVGYQTDIEGKMSTDMKKWKDVLGLLRVLGIRCTVVTCADASMTPARNWWIPENKVLLLKSSISFLFSEFQKNSPAEVTDIVVGSISTQKLRSMLKAGSVVKTPISIKEVRETWEKQKEYILERPTGVRVPEDLVTSLKLGLVDGVVMEQQSAEACIDLLKREKNKIIDAFERTKFKHTVNRNLITSQEMLTAWLKEDLPCARCSDCVEQIKESLEKPSCLEDKLSLLCYHLQPSNHKPCCHPLGSKNFPQPTVRRRTVNMNDVEHSTVKSFENSNESISLLDRLVRLTLPGKTEKERRIKRNVEALIRYCMEKSNIDCIKLPTGQLVSKGHAGQRRTKENLDEWSDRLKKELSEEKLKTYSEYVRQTLKHSLEQAENQANSKCQVPMKWMKSLIQDLGVPTEDGQIITKLKESQKAKKNFKINNDKVVIVSKDELGEYVSSKLSHCLSDSKVFQLDCVVFKEVSAELMLRLQSSPYETCPKMLLTLIDFMLQFGWYQELVLYSKICETFLRCCTEFTRSGIKLVKIKHTNLNLGIKLPSNKKENMTCCIYNSNMSLMKGPFMMNRRQAILGASYSYILVVVFVQCLQQYRCLDAILSNRADLKKQVESCMQSMAEAIFEELTHALSGDFEKASQVRNRQCEITGNFLTKNTHDHFIRVFSGLAVNYFILSCDSLLRNSQQQNKQLQMLRFGMLNGLSRLSSPSELGKKFHSSCRTVEDNVIRLYLQTTVYCAVREVETNIEQWNISDLCPRSKIPSFSIYGAWVNSDRQLIFDIYNVHIYNKEMDNFDEGCIDVLEETAERHMLWELDLARTLGSRKGHHKREGRLLMGIPNASRIRTLEGERLLTCDSVLDNESETGSTSSTVTRRSIGSSSKRIKSIYGRYCLNIKPFELESGFKIERDPLRDYRQAITDVGTNTIYRPNLDSLLKDCLTIIKTNPSHTMGSFELIQAITEAARVKFPPDAIEKSRKNTKNWVSVSEVTETTSIVSVPKTHMLLKDAFKILLGTENKKIVKLLRGKLKKLGVVSTDEKMGKTYCQDLLNTVEGLTERQKDMITKGLLEPHKLSFYHWKELVKKQVTEVLLTDDGNYIYCWLKTLAAHVKKDVKRELKFMIPSRDITDVPAESIFDEGERAELIKLKKLVMSEAMSEKLNIDAILSAWSKSALKVKEGDNIIKTGIASMLAALPALTLIFEQYDVLCQSKLESPAVSFTKEEINIRMKEKKFIEQFSREIMECMNLVFFLTLTAPWCVHYKSLEAFFIRNPGIANLESTDVEPDCQLLDMTVSSMVCRLANNPVVSDSDLEVPSDAQIKKFIEYLITAFTVNGLPLSESLNTGESGKTVQGEEQILQQLKGMLSRMGLKGGRHEFLWTIHLIANSNFEVTKKLTGRQTGERLPRSVRSKVVYEVIKMVGETGMAILQQLAFTCALNTEHRFFAVLAPKAQLGGCRDLLVQETGTKLIHATTEMFSRTLLSTTNDDGLTNSHLKENILNVGLESIQTMKMTHGKPVESFKGLVNFYRVMCISGDNTKWGPIHCCSLFSGMMQQLLKDVPDWCQFYKLTFIKNLCRQVEIPSASIKKILNTLRYHISDSTDIEALTERDIRQMLLSNLDLWEHNQIIQFLVKTYISKGQMAMNSYNHMGQGIHHATSSILTSAFAVTFEELARDFFSECFPELTLKLDHAGSSDDYAKCLVLSGVLSASTFKTYDETFWDACCRFKNLTAAVARCCQMKDSAKTLVGDSFLEFYSEFMMGNRVTPAVIKFILTGLINSSVTSPQSMSQACQVSSQQAMYNSVPMLTNITFTTLRQQMFFNHIEPFIREYGLITLGTLSPFGRLFVPKFSNLIGSSVALEDSEVISCSARVLKLNYHGLPVSSKTVIDSDSSISSDTGDTSSDASLSSTSESSGSSFKFELTRNLTQTEELFAKTIQDYSIPVNTEVVSDELELMYRESKEGPLDPKQTLKGSILAESCSWLKSATRMNPLELAVRIRSVLNVLIAGHYRSFGSEGTEHMVKASLNRDENAVIEDPMIQLIPEKLRRELGRLGLHKMSVEELLPGLQPEDTLASLVARRLITLNVSTEDYNSEVARLKQTLTARNVIHGLAGGIKELSVPLYTIFMTSYFFKDNVFFELEDRWNTKHSTNYRDSTGKLLNGKVVTKYPVWLDTFLNCRLTCNTTRETIDGSLFNDSLRGFEVLLKSGQPRELSLILSDLEILHKEFAGISIQFSDCNRQKLRIVESQPPEAELEANKAVIVKSKLFSATESISLNNTPAVVIGYLLDEACISEVRPTRIDLSNLLKDKFKLTQFYPAIIELVTSICTESKLNQQDLECNPDLNKVGKYSNNLTMLCRMIQKAKPTLTVFYMLKGSHSTNEPTVSELVSYGIKEGRYLKLPEPGIDTSSFSVRYWKILHCISAINSLVLSDSEKTSMLVSFLNWKPSLELAVDECPMNVQERSVLEEFDDKVLLNVLASELPSIRNEQERKGIGDLIDYIVSPRELLKKKPYLGTTAQFKTWGEGHKTGRFIYNSPNGEATGIFIRGKLHIHLSAESKGLLYEVEKNVLSWLSRRRTDLVSKEQHEFFTEMLPSDKEVTHKGKDGKIVSVSLDKGDIRMLSIHEVRLGSKVIKIKQNILTVKKQIAYSMDSEPRLIWSKGHISIVYDELETETTYHENILKVRKILEQVVGKSANPANATFSETRVTLTRIRLKDDVVLNSIALLHVFMHHAPKAAILEMNSKNTLLSRYLSGGHVKESCQVFSGISSSKKTAAARQLKGRLIDSNITDKELCESLSKEFRSAGVPPSSWPEVQVALEENGLSAIEVGLEKQATKADALWQFSQELDSPKLSAIWNFRTLVGCVSSETIPQFMIPFLSSINDFMKYFQVFKRIRRMLNEINLKDEELDCLVMLLVIKSYHDEIVTDGVYFSPESLLSIVRSRSFTLKNRVKLEFNTREGKLQFIISVLMLSESEMSQDKKLNLRVSQQNLLTTMSNIFLDVSNMKSIKDLSLNMDRKANEWGDWLDIVIGEESYARLRVDNTLNIFLNKKVPDAFVSELTEVIRSLIGKCNIGSLNLDGEVQEVRAEVDYTIDELFETEETVDQEPDSMPEPDSSGTWNFGW
ncbi:RNA-dependent RNA polymerase [Orthonairovirus sakhalinense]|uniref:RNA-directed RNA polymerase L n=3 Tax=Orthonairovirus sakhalinense TaxID=3052534 RepID=A0A191KWB8_9VIRU|nr:RNA-dependent RNA polymerase [Orthonairovirus sakhalinense]